MEKNKTIKKTPVYDELPTCPKCGEIAREILDNAGDEYNTAYSVIGFKCPEHGFVHCDDVIVKKVVIYYK